MNITPLSNPSPKDLELLYQAGDLEGIFSGISNEVYHHGPGASTSLLKAFRTPAHGLAYMKRPASKSTPAQVLGTAVHSAVLEPKDFMSRLEVVKDRLGKNGIAAREAEAAGKLVLTEAQSWKVRAMAEAVLSHPVARELFTAGHPELSCFWRDGNGLLRKCRPDYLRDDGRTLVDLKTFGELGEGDHDVYALERQIWKMKYHWQSAWYCSVLSGLLGVPVTLFYHVFVEEPSDPSDHVSVRVAWLNDAALEKAAEDYAARAKLMASCMDAGSFPSYSPEPVEIGLPSYAW